MKYPSLHKSFIYQRGFYNPMKQKEESEFGKRKSPKITINFNCILKCALQPLSYVQIGNFGLILVFYRRLLAITHVKLNLVVTSKTGA